MHKRKQKVKLFFTNHKIELPMTVQVACNSPLFPNSRPLISTLTMILPLLLNITPAFPLLHVYLNPSKSAITSKIITKHPRHLLPSLPTKSYLAQLFIQIELYNPFTHLPPLFTKNSTLAASLTFYHFS
jgi:hypothetical protein